MLKGHSLIYFAPEQWGGLWRNRQQLMSIFARHNKVLFVERRKHLRTTLSELRQGKIEGSELSHPTIRHIADNLFVLRYPVWAPVSGRFPLEQLTQTIRRRTIERAMAELQMSEPIVWFSRPEMVDLIDEIPPARLLLYHVVDEYSAYSGQTSTSRSHTEMQEERIMALADAIVVVSQKLYQSKSPFNAHTYLVPNGVNYDAYTTALNESYIPDIFQTIPSPRLGYSGLVGDRLNFDMLLKLASDHPEWSLVFLGEARVSGQAEQWQALSVLPNVYYLGLVDIAQVPYYLKGFDVGLMPYAQTREADNISPLKLYDYLAAGLPVASIDIPAARTFADYIHLAAQAEAFEQAVQAALADTTPESRQTRRSVAHQHTWDARVEQLSDLIQEQLKIKS